MLWLVKSIANVGLRGDHAKAIKQLTWLMMLPSPNGDAGRVQVLYHLGHRCYVAKRYSEAIAWFDRLLAVATLPPHINTVTHKHYADCCEALGRVEQAAQHRDEARGSANSNPNNYSAVVTHGAESERQSRFGDAYEIYKTGLEKVALTPIQRQKLHAKMAISSHRMGRFDLCIQAANLAIVDNTSPSTTSSMHRMAGSSYSNLGDLDQAQFHLEQASTLAARGDDKGVQAECLAMLSGVALQKGHTLEALAMAQRSVAIHSPPTRVCCIHLFEALMALGRYVDAWHAITGEKEDIFFNPRTNRTMEAVDVLCQARVCMATERYGDALEFWKQGFATFAADKKMEMYCSCLGLAIKAYLGQKEDVRRSIRPMQEDIKYADVGRGNKLDYLGYLIRATSTIDEHTMCMNLLDDFRALSPHPGSLPTPLYYAGESCRKAGETDNAVAFFREAASACPEAIYAQRAGLRLAELEAG